MSMVSLVSRSALQSSVKLVDYNTNVILRHTKANSIFATVQKTSFVFNYSSPHYSTTSTVSSDKHQWTKPSGYNTGIKVWNSLTKRKDQLIITNKQPNQLTNNSNSERTTKDYISWYMCGPTVYDESHIGHAR